MFKAAFFAANRQPLDENHDKAAGQSMTFENQDAESFKGAAARIADQSGFKVTDEGRAEFAYRFPRMRSFGVEGHTHRLFVWSVA